jgi:hypothetical protein
MWYYSYEYDRMQKLSDERKDLAYGIVREPAGPVFESDLSDEEQDTLHRRKQRSGATETGGGDIHAWARSVANGRPYRVMVDTLPMTECKHKYAKAGYIYVVEDAETGEQIQWLNGYLI